MAASGGYWISTPADKIYALPSTLTGSIGVVMGKFVMEDLWNKIGVNWNGVQWGQNADLLSFNSDFDEVQAVRMNKLIDSTYQAFLERVAGGRDMSIEDTKKVAKGRPWTGAQAVKNGLVDKLGGLDVALNDVAKEAGLTNKDDLNIIVMPKPRTPFEQFLEVFGQQVALGQFLNNHTSVLQALETAMGEAAVIAATPRYTVYDAGLDALR